MIQSDLLYLTPLAKDDFNLFVEIYTDPQLMEHVGPAFNQESIIKLFKNCLNQIASEEPKYLFYVIKSKHTEEKFGIIGLLWNQPEKTSVELGVMIAEPYINKAYAYKATYLLMQYVFTKLELKSMIILCNESNTVANRATKAIGFQNKESLIDKKSDQRKIKWEITAQRFDKINKNRRDLV
jgi:RimJ/RimL family protein N-acetyltransferase